MFDPAPSTIFHLIFLCIPAFAHTYKLDEVNYEVVLRAERRLRKKNTNLLPVAEEEREKNAKKHDSRNFHCPEEEEEKK